MGKQRCGSGVLKKKFYAYKWRTKVGLASLPQTEAFICPIWKGTSFLPVQNGLVQSSPEIYFLHQEKHVTSNIRILPKNIPCIFPGSCFERTLAATHLVLPSSLSSNHSGKLLETLVHSANPDLTSRTNQCKSRPRSPGQHLPAIISTGKPTLTHNASASTTV